MTRNRSFLALSLAKGAKEVTKFLGIVEQVRNSVHKLSSRTSRTFFRSFGLVILDLWCAPHNVLFLVIDINIAAIFIGR